MVSWIHIDVGNIMNLCLLCDYPTNSHMVFLPLKNWWVIRHWNMKQGNKSLDTTNLWYLIHAHQCSQHHYLQLSRRSNLSNQSSRSTNDKEDVVHTHTHWYYSVIKWVVQFHAIAWWIGLGRHYDKWNKSENEKYYRYHLYASKSTTN